MSEENRNFTDEDIKAMVRAFFEYGQQKLGEGLLKGVWALFIGFVIACFFLGLAMKLKVPLISG